MSKIVPALGWAAAMIAIALASQSGLFGEELASFLMMATLAAWVAASSRRNCGAGSMTRN